MTTLLEVQTVAGKAVGGTVTPAGRVAHPCVRSCEETLRISVLQKR